MNKSTSIQCPWWNLDAHTGPVKGYDIISTRQFRIETQLKKKKKKKSLLSNISERPICEQTRTHTHELHSDKCWQAGANSHCYVAHMLQVHPPAQFGLSGWQIHWHTYSTWTSTAPIHANSLPFRIKSAALGHVHMLQYKRFNSNT